MTMTMDLPKIQILWVVGALERLATLGILESTPLKVSQSGLDSYLLIDEHRDKLFYDNEQMKDLLKYILISENGTYDQELHNDLFRLLKEYKDNRTDFMRKSLSLK